MPFFMLRHESTTRKNLDGSYTKEFFYFYI